VLEEPLSPQSFFLTMETVHDVAATGGSVDSLGLERQPLMNHSSFDSTCLDIHVLVAGSEFCARWCKSVSGGWV
jgi:hypothetical protein